MIPSDYVAGGVSTILKGTDLEHFIIVKKSNGAVGDTRTTAVNNTDFEF